MENALPEVIENSNFIFTNLSKIESGQSKFSYELFKDLYQAESINEANKEINQKQQQVQKFFY